MPSYPTIGALLPPLCRAVPRISEQGASGEQPNQEPLHESHDQDCSRRGWYGHLIPSGEAHPLTFVTYVIAEVRTACAGRSGHFSAQLSRGGRKNQHGSGRLHNLGDLPSVPCPREHNLIYTSRSVRRQAFPHLFWPATRRMMYDYLISD